MYAQLLIALNYIYLSVVILKPHMIIKRSEKIFYIHMSYWDLFHNQLNINI